MLAPVIKITLLLLSVSLCAAVPIHYNSSEAMDGWYYSKSAFCSLSDIQSWTCAACSYFKGMESITTYHNNDTGAQAFTAYDSASNRIVVAWRGSADIQNWINNLDFFFIDYPNTACSAAVNSSCQVHRGFLNVYQSVSAAVMSETTKLVAQYISRSPQLLITGHSLGGALSILSAVDVSLAFRDKIDDIVVYTYGEPRVGNPAWAQWVSLNVLEGTRQFRLTHKADPVPRLPPLEFGFLHVPHELWYNNNLAGNNYKNCSDNAFHEDYTCDDSQIAFDTQDHLLYLGVPAGCNSGSVSIA